MKRFVMMAAAGLLFFSAESMMAQCTEKASTAGEKKSCCASKATMTKATMTEAKLVTREELASMLQEKSVVVVDARDEEQFKAGHIEGAILMGAQELPENKDAVLVFYCGSMKCPASSKAAKKAIELGYTNVLVYKGGWAEWNQKS